MTTTEPYAALEVPPAGRAIDVRRQPVGTGLPTPVRGGYWQSVLRFGLAGNTVEPLIDGRPAFAAMQRAIESAQTNDHFIYLLAWWCDPWVNLTGPGTCLLDLFARAGRRGVQIRVLLWDPPHLVYPNPSRLHGEAVRALNRLPNCHAQQDDAGTTKSHHQKLLVVRGREGLIALAGGVDVNVDRLHRLPPPPGAVRADRPAGLGWIGGSGGSGGSGSGAAGRPTCWSTATTTSSPSTRWASGARHRSPPRSAGPSSSGEGRATTRASCSATSRPSRHCCAREGGCRST